MAKNIFTAAALLLISIMFLGLTYAQDLEQTNSPQPNNGIPEGMEARSIDNNPGYKVLLPKGATIRKQGDLMVVEGPGEFAARKFVEYDEQLAQINAKIDSLRKKLDEIKKNNQEQ